MTSKDEKRGSRKRVAPAYLRKRAALRADGSRASDYAITYLWVDGRRHQVHLGPWMSAESCERFARVLSHYVLGEETAALEAAPSNDGTVTVEELVGQFLRHADGYYRGADLRPTGETQNFVDAVLPLLELFGPSPVESFGAPQPIQVREHIARTGPRHKKKRKQNRTAARAEAKPKPKKPLSVTTVNARVQRIRRVFRWGVPRQLVSVAVVQELEQVDGLKRGRVRDLRVPARSVRSGPATSTAATTPSGPTVRRRTRARTSARTA